MAGQVLSPSDSTPFPGVIEFSSFCPSTSSSARKGLVSESDMEIAVRASEIGLGCVRGTTIALALEAAAALGVYGSWYLWHFIR